ncbi:MAG: Trk system potassium transporter TrkA [Pyramidobacter sp.]|nr:Trk system potassium transporter TrkA [Pyramidobacter sp.]MBR0107998.1 Trk system potassium transporter TrkA [Pyramidobacter sp.]
MKVVIVGAGNVGMTLARTLSEDAHDVVVVDRNEDLATRIAEELDVSVVRGNGSRPDVLAQAGVVKDGGVDVLIACTDRDETNLMACWLAKRAGVPRVLSRVRDLEFTDTPDWAQDLGIDVMASPERSLSREIASLLRFNAAVHTSELFNGRAGSFAFHVEKDSPICGLSLRELGLKYPQLGAIVVYVERGEDGFVPSGEWTAQEGDVCFVVTLHERVTAIQKLFDVERQKRLSRVIIVGGGKLGTNLAKRLCSNVPKVETTLVEKNLEKCERLAREFPDVKVINGDGMDSDLMKQLGVDKANGVVAATSNDELNVIIAALANINENVKTVAVVRKDVYKELEDRLPVDVLVNPNRTLANTFLRYIRYPSSAGMLSLIDRIGAEMLEFLLRPGNPAVGRRIMDLNLPRGILIAVIKRGGKYLVPGGAETLQEGDVISVFAMSEKMPEAMHFFKVD